MKIYTKTGDNGKTRLVDGSCVEKFNPRVEAYGTADELNSYLGLLRNELKNLQLTSSESVIHKIQHKLFVIGSLLATEKNETFQMLPQISSKDALDLETEIDTLTAQLEPLKNFILPAGHPASVTAHITRTLCRRCERRSVEISINDDRLRPSLIYLNRLSDYLFTLARFINLKTQTTETLWDKTL
jgi:cob(I)alamin adenosyltransferase